MNAAVHDDYREAFNSAVALAREMRREVGLEKVDEYGKTRYAVRLLPAAPYRHGWELRCQVVRPDEPFMA